jgi:hypothetical protein
MEDTRENSEIDEKLLFCSAHNMPTVPNPGKQDEIRQ